MFPPGTQVVTETFSDNSRPLRIVHASESLPAPGRDFPAFMSKAKARFTMAASAENPMRMEALDDTRFYAGDQWLQEIRYDRELSGRPCLTINKLQGVVRQIVNEERQSRPAIQVNPIGSGADQMTAEILQGLIRHIELDSQADIAYDEAFKQAVIGGFGYFRIFTTYSTNDSFDQDIKIKRVIDPFTVYFDPTCQEPDYSDAEWAFVVEDLTPEQYRAHYPNTSMSGLDDFRSTGDDEREWFINGKIRIAEYFYVESEEKTLVKLTNGTTVFEEDLSDIPQGVSVQLDRRTKKPITRKTNIRTVHWCKMNAREIIEETVWPGQWIPIIPVLGDETIVDGVRKLSGVVRYAKDPQRQYNFMRSAIVEAIALAPKAPWVIAEGQDESYEKEFQQANRRNLASIHYKPTTVDNMLVPPPARQVVEPAIQAMTIAMAQSDSDMNKTTGVYEAGLGQIGPEQSGRAILARQQKSENANFNYTDNLGRAIRAAGRQIVDLVQVVYNSPRVVRIVKPDNQQEMVTINQQYHHNGENLIHDVTVGKYDVGITVGPSYQSKRAEFVASVLSLVNSSPQIFPMVGDLLVRNMDWPGATDIADRLHKMLPPQLQEDGGPPPDPQALAQAQQLIQSMAAQIESLKKGDELKLEIERMKAESAERRTTQTNIAGIYKAEVQSKDANAVALAQMDHDAVKHQLDQRAAILDRASDVELSGQDQALSQAHDQRMQAADHDHQQSLQEQQLAAQKAQAEAAPAAPAGQ